VAIGSPLVWCEGSPTEEVLVFGKISGSAINHWLLFFLGFSISHHLKRQI